MDTFHIIAVIISTQKCFTILIHPLEIFFDAQNAMAHRSIDATRSVC